MGDNIVSTRGVEIASSGSVPYEAVIGWGSDLPDMRGRDVSDVTVGPDDLVYLLYRDPSMVVVADPDGHLRATIGRGVIHRAHGVTPAGERTYVVDEIDHIVRVFDNRGGQVAQIGGGPSNPEFPM